MNNLLYRVTSGIGVAADTVRFTPMEMMPAELQPAKPLINALATGVSALMHSAIAVANYADGNKPGFIHSASVVLMDMVSNWQTVTGISLLTHASNMVCGSVTVSYDDGRQPAPKNVMN